MPESFDDQVAATARSTALVVADRTDIVQADADDARSAILHVVATGDYSRLTDAQRGAIYLELCTRLGLEVATRPLDWIEFYDPQTRAKKLTLYPKASCADQLAYKHQITVGTVAEEMVGSAFKVTMKGTDPTGRTETNVAYLDLVDREGKRLTGQRYYDALMKCHTKCKRRLIFGMVGMLSPNDDAIEQGRRVVVDGSGAIVEHPTSQDRALADDPRLQRVLQMPTYESTAAEHGPLLDAVASPMPEPPREPEPPRTPYPAARFHCDKRHWLGVWHMLVKGTFLAEDEARHDFVGWYTSTYPPERRTASLSTFLDHATDRQAEAIVNRARETLAERAAFAPAAPDDDPETMVYPERPDPRLAYDVESYRELYAAWAGELGRRDAGFRPLTGPALVRLSADDLRRELDSVIGQVDSIDIMLAMEDQPGFSGEDDDNDDQPPF